MQTARFTAVVARAGRPQVHPLWLAPDKDPELKRAVRDCRVMTIHQALRGSKKDHGSVGLHQDGSASTQVLVFPKSLRRFGDRRIVGVDYKLIVEPKVKNPAPPPPPMRKFVPPPPLAPVAVIPKPLPKPAPKPAPPPAPAPKMKSPPPAAKLLPPRRPAPATRDELLSEIRRAVRELKTGKAVAAYERLSA